MVYFRDSLTESQALLGSLWKVQNRRVWKASSRVCAYLMTFSDLIYLIHLLRIMPCRSYCSHVFLRNIETSLYVNRINGAELLFSNKSDFSVFVVLFTECLPYMHNKCM